ncbi:MAG: SOS response-associated peptidase family protein [Clostridia bacterium]|nr:SOS response-associated peptidase family protein [Clostridia bacterium]
MCGRYFIESDALDFDGYLDWEDACESVATGDVSPGDHALAIIEQDSRAVPRVMRWGFGGQSGKAIINARLETLGEKPMFKGLEKRQRCALPASLYYEWRRADGQKYAVGIKDSSLFFLAGLYRIGERGSEFVVVTQPPVSQIRRIHDRMPLILPDMTAAEAWLRGDDARFEQNEAVSVRAEGSEQLSMIF